MSHPSKSSPTREESSSVVSRFRRPTVFDATAGRVSAAGFIPKHPVIASTRDTASSSNSALPPEAVLFRHKHAPVRYAESDIYFNNERNGIEDLPDSDLLKALHRYTSDFYSRSTTDGGLGDWKTLDETALIALGILMEEAALAILGKTGDLVFTEGEAVEFSVESAPVSVGERPGKKRRLNGHHRHGMH